MRKNGPVRHHGGRISLEEGQHIFQGEWFFGPGGTLLEQGEHAHTLGAPQSRKVIINNDLKAINVANFYGCKVSSQVITNFSDNSTHRGHAGPMGDAARPLLNWIAQASSYARKSLASNVGKATT